MNIPEKASFNFNSYKITNFSYAEPKRDYTEISVSFSPTGIFIKKNSVFFLTVNIKVLYGDNNEYELLSVDMQSDFSFQNIADISEIPPYFYANSIAIIYPYLRAFISTLTSLANLKPLILGLLNLSGLENLLKENTVIKTD